MRRLELWIQILEINENGDFVPVEVVPARDVDTGGIFQLRQVGVHRTPVTSKMAALTGSNPLPGGVLFFFLFSRVSRGGSRWTCARSRTRGRCR